MTVKTGGAWAGTFVTLDATGALATPGTGPAGVLYVDGTANGASVTITGSNPYKWAVTLPSLTAGQRVDMYITATIATIATAAVVASEQADTSLLSDGVAVASIANDAITAAAIKADAVAEIADGVLDEAMAGHVGAGTLGKAIADTLEDTGTSIPADLVDIENKIDVIATDTTTEIPASITALDGKIDTIDNFLDTEVAAILADTNELQTDLVNGGRLDLLIDGIKAKTDNLPSDPADQSAVEGAITSRVNLLKSAVEGAITSAVTSIKGIDGDTLKVLSDQIDGVSPAAIADAVWDEALSGHTTTGTAGDTLADIDVSGVATAVWAASTRTLTQSAASVTATVSGSDITCTRGDSLSASLTDVGALTGYSKIYFTVKRDHDDADAVSIIQIEKTAGLKYINGAAAVTSANGTLTIGDEATGDITIALDEVETAKLSAGVYYYDVQIVRSAGTVSTLTSGEFTVSADVTRATT